MKSVQTNQNCTRDEDASGNDHQEIKALGKTFQWVTQMDDMTGMIVERNEMGHDKPLELKLGMMTMRWMTHSQLESM